MRKELPLPAAKKRPPLSVGATGYARHKGREYALIVVASEAGGIAYKVGRATYASPSAAAKAIAGCETNGWRFWHL